MLKVKTLLSSYKHTNVAAQCLASSGRWRATELRTAHARLHVCSLNHGSDGALHCESHHGDCLCNASRDGGGGGDALLCVSRGGGGGGLHWRSSPRACISLLLQSTTYSVRRMGGSTPVAYFFIPCRAQAIRSMQAVWTAASANKGTVEKSDRMHTLVDESIVEALSRKQIASDIWVCQHS